MCDDRKTAIEALLLWLREKLTAAEKELRARQQAEEAWRGGTDEAWKAVGCRKTKKQRIEESRLQARLALRSRRDVENLHLLIAAIVELNRPETT